MYASAILPISRRLVRVPSESHEKAQAAMGLSLSSLAAAISKAVETAVTAQSRRGVGNPSSSLPFSCCFDRCECPLVDAVSGRCNDVAEAL